MNNSFGKVLKHIVKVIGIILVIAVIVAVIAVGTVVYMRWHRDASEKSLDEKNALEKLMTGEEKKLEPTVNCLFLGTNGALTDFIMLGQYDPNTREIDLLSIPRDTYVGNASYDGKLNSIYANFGVNKLKSKIAEITGIEVDYYIIFKTKILRELVNAIGGVTVDIPINMNYDDPYQNLYIHLNKGTKKLTGSEAEQFCRFRKNNDGTGYPGGDVDRTKAQQKFVKAFIGEILKAGNISKIPELIDIVLKGTKTDVTMDVATKYLDDVIALRTDRITTNTLPGEGRYEVSPYGYKLSYFFPDKEKSKALIDEMFFNKENDVSGDSKTSGENTVPATSSSVIAKDDNKNNKEEVKNAKDEAEVKDEKIRIELLNAGASSKVINELVSRLTKNNYYVAKIGNFNSTTKEYSRIIDYVGTDDATIKELKDIIGNVKTEASKDGTNVSYTIIIGPSYNLKSE